MENKENNNNNDDVESEESLEEDDDQKGEKRNGKGIKKLPEYAPLNDSFFTPVNMAYFNHVVMNYIPDVNKAIIFLPCGSANKTRNKKRINGKIDLNGEVDPRKFISEGMGHNYMKAIRDDKESVKIILSEPLVLIPYELEGHPMRPDYNLPVDRLCIMGEDTFINRLSQWLLKLKFLQPGRTHVYYCGGTHHFLILYFANKRAGSPFQIIHSVGDINQYTRLAEGCIRMMHDLEDRSILPKELQSVDELIERFLKSRGRYTHRRFWKSIIQLHVPTEKEKREFKKVNEKDMPTETLDGKEYNVETIEICSPEFNHQLGFGGLYEIEQADKYNAQRPRKTKTLLDSY